MESPQKAYIEKIRREIFRIGADTPNPLASSLHEAIRHLSAELYQKDIHFISELIQNAEDNTYNLGVEPELHLVLTQTDITGVGASATLILFNSEVGFEERNILALCSVGQSTKKGQRNEGYIGEKGIGFKSAFVVTSTPYIISNGFRIRFNDSGEESAGSAAQIGYIVPQWVERPTDDELRRFWFPATGSDSLPRTIIILPLRSEKVASVQAELRHVSPETILFLRRITRLRIRDETVGNVSRNEVLVTRSDSCRVLHGDDNAVEFTTKLSVVKEPGHTMESCDYFVWEQRFDVTASVEQRMEVKTWVISLAFPKKDRIAGGSHGSVYAFLPSQLNSGFPFIVNADFLLVSSRETLKFDSLWNKGILACVPTAFCKAMGVLLRKYDDTRVSPPHMYRYVPLKECHAQLKSVQEKILCNLQSQDSILVALNVRSEIQDLCRPSMSRRVSGSFRKILEKAFKEQNVSAAVSNSAWFIVHGAIQENHSGVLDKLSVPWMTSSEYMQILGDSNWLLTLSDELYLEVLAFVSALCSQPLPVWDRFRENFIKCLNIVKYEYSGEIRLMSIRDIEESKVAMYISPPQQGSYLSKWIRRFGPWIQYRFMPEQTVNVMGKAGNHAVVKWLRDVALVRKIDVAMFASELVARVTKGSAKNSQHTVESSFVLLVWKFVYTSIQEGVLEGMTIGRGYDFLVVDESGRVQWVKAQGPTPLVLLPRSCSKWPVLLTNRAWSAHANDIIRMSEDYLDLYVDNDRDRRYGREECRIFLQKTFHAADLPNLPLPDVPFPELADLTSEQSRLLLQWLSSNIETIESLDNQNKFCISLKRNAWLHTDEHGLQRPEMCFVPTDELKRLFEPSEVPFIDESFYGDVNPYAGVLETLGVISRPECCCGAVAEMVKGLINEAVLVSSKEISMKYYSYLQIYNWNPQGEERSSMKIFVPAGSVNTNSQASWQMANNCVIRDPENLFEGELPILCNIYPKKLLSFFEKALDVPNVPSYTKYYDLWVQWRENLMPYDMKQCTQLWEKIAINWERCSDLEKRTFKLNAAVLTVTNCEEVNLKSAELAFIPDDLHLRNIFMTNSSTAMFVWYPKGFSKYEAQLNSVYEYLGAKKLSDCVEIISDVDVNTLSKCNADSTPKFITRGLIVAILGFISNKEYTFTSEERQSIIAPLCKSVEEEMPHPCRVLYTISAEASKVTTTVESHLFGFWDGEGVVYRLREAHELLKDASNVRELETQVLESICSKIMPDYPSVATTLVDFLKMLVGCRFDEAAVVYELRRKNLKLYRKDLELLDTAANQILNSLLFE